MKKLLTVLFIFFLVGGAFAQQEKRYVVKLKDKGVFTDATGEDRDQRFQNREVVRRQKVSRVEDLARGKGVNQILETFSDVEVGFVAEMNDNQVNALRNDTEVESVLEDFIMQGRPRMQARRPRMQARPRMQQEYGYDVEFGTNCAILEAGGGEPSRGIERNFIWVIDSGIDGRHQDLRRSISRSRKYAKSFIDADPWTDEAGHGTFVAGLAAAQSRPTGNRFAMNGASPGAPLVSLKVLDANGAGFWSDIVLALDHVAKYGNKGDVVTMSLGAFGVDNCANSNPMINEAIKNVADKGIFVVMSSGNEGGDANTNLPGCISGPNIFTVGSVDFNCADGLGGCSSFSNLGSTVDWVVAGDPVFSTFPGNEYQVWSGTSMSAAMVAGIIFASQGTPAVAGTVSCGGRTYNIPKIK